MARDQSDDNEPIKVGGQALADGVLMRTSRAWAIARQDGSVEVGAVAPNPLAKVPVLRIVAGLFSALKLGIGRGMMRGSRAAGKHKANSKLNRRLLLILVGLELAAFAFTRQAGDVAASAPAIAATTIVTFAVLRLATPKSLWRYHGAEHKAVAAFEQGVDMADTAAVLKADRVHDRCGTNLVFIVLLAGVGLRDVASGLWELPAFLLLIGATAEVVTLAAKRPQHVLSRAVLGGGKALQRWVTTAEPTPAEQAVGCQALAAAVAEHVRLTALAALDEQDGEREAERPVAALATAAA